MARPHISYHQRCFECTQALNSIELSEEVPHLDSDVLTVGYPMGGENICVTRGVVSWHIRTRGGSHHLLMDMGWQHKHPISIDWDGWLDPDS